MKNEKERKRSLKVRIIVGIVVLVLLAVIATIVFSFFMAPNALRVENGVFYRNLDFCTWLLEDEDNPAPLQKDGIPVSRLTPWDSELPFLIEYDIEYSKKHECNIQYTFNGNKIYIRFNDGEAELSINHGRSDFMEITNFSMYFSGEDLVIYGFRSQLKDSFSTTTIKGSDEKGSHSGFFYSLTYNLNIPFNVDYNISIFADDIGDYTVYVHQDEPEKITFWKDGEELNTSIFPKKVKYNEPRYGFLMTEDKKIYVSYLKDSQKTDFDYAYVGKIDDIITERDYLSNGFYMDSFDALYAPEEYDIVIPILIIGNDYYTICPEDWDTYIAYSTASRKILNSNVNNPNYKVKFAKLLDCFDSAEFYFNGNNWISYINFNINGKKLVYTYVVDGYDRNISISKIENDIEKCQKTVYSIDEFWDLLETIRDIYKPYYDYRPED